MRTADARSRRPAPAAGSERARSARSHSTSHASTGTVAQHPPRADALGVGGGHRSSRQDVPVSSRPRQPSPPTRQGGSPAGPQSSGSTPAGACLRGAPHPTGSRRARAGQRRPYGSATASRKHPQLADGGRLEEAAADQDLAGDGVVRACLRTASCALSACQFCRHRIPMLVPGARVHQRSTSEAASCRSSFRGTVAHAGATAAVAVLGPRPQPVGVVVRQPVVRAPAHEGAVQGVEQRLARPEVPGEREGRSWGADPRLRHASGSSSKALPEAPRNR